MARRPRWTFQPPVGTPIDLSHPQAEGLVAFWPMSDSSGASAFDIGPYRRHLTLTNTPSRPVAAHGRSLECASASSQYASVDATGALKDLAASPFTVSGWFYFVDEASEGVISTDNSGGVNVGWEFGHDQLERVRFIAQYSTTDFDLLTETSALPVPPAWTHLVAVVNGADASTSSIYINGIESGSYVTQTSGSGTYQTDDAGIWFGRRGIGNYYNCGFSGLRFYDRLLSAQEVLDLYTNPYDIYQSPRSSVSVPAAGATGQEPVYPWATTMGYGI